MPLLILVLVFPLGVRAEADVQPETNAWIDDEAKLFSAEAIDRANTELTNIWKEHQPPVGLYIKTVAELPEKDRKKFPWWRTGRRADYFNALAAETAAETGVDGLCVVICKHPIWVTVLATSQSREEYFRYPDRELLRKGINDKVLNGGQAARDKALLDLVGRFDRLIRDKGPDVAAPRPGWQLLLSMVGGLFGLWIVLAIVRHQVRRRENARLAQLREPNFAREPDPLPGMLGSRFGAPPAFWLYDRLFHPLVSVPPPPSASAQPAYSTAVTNTAPPQSPTNITAPAPTDQGGP